MVTTAAGNGREGRMFLLAAQERMNEREKNRGCPSSREREEKRREEEEERETLQSQACSYYTVFLCVCVHVILC